MSLGARLRALRAFVNLSRKDLEKRYDLKEITLKAWEFDQVRVISDTSLQKILLAFNQEGCPCSKEWLVHGLGPSPFDQRSSKEDFYIEKLPSNAMVMSLTHDIFPPLLTKNDMVAGLPSKNPSPGALCIFILDIPVCGFYHKSRNIVSIQKNAGHNSFLYDVKPKRIYEVIWIKKWTSSLL